MLKEGFSLILYSEPFMQGQRLTIVNDIKDMKPFNAKGSMEVVCCDGFNAIAR